MIQDLSDKVWSNPRFHTTAKAVEAAWLRRELGINTESLVTENIAARAMEAAAILACSRQLERRRAAHRVATCAFELFEKSDLPFDAALRVVLARLSNFPAMITKKEIDDSISTLPWVFALEELVAADRTTIQINNRLVRLTNYQRRLWDSLQRKQSVALSAPTSAGKSFILQLYISSIFANGAPSVVYIVPTRALISQVAREIDELFRKEGQVVPEIVTVPLRSGADPPSSSIYVMTQERVHLSLESNPLLHATLLVVDEAHSIAEGSRGILLHSVIDQLLRRNPTAQVLFASPTTRNLSLFGELFALEVERRPSREPTVSQNFLFVSSNSPAKGHVAISATDGTRQPISIGEIQTGLALSSRIDRLAHLPDKLCARQPNLVYANGADEAEEIALRIARTRENREPTARLLALRTLSAESVHRKYILGECVIKGVGFHYSNIPTVVRHEIEAAFASGDLDCLVCTSTLLQGVNLPAKNIFMLKPTRGRDSPMESPDFWNLSGRAGRLMREFQGNIFLIDYHSWSRKPLSGPKDTEIASAIETTVRFRQEELANVIAGAEGGRFRRRPIDLDSAFVRLLSDLRDGSLRQTFERIGLPASERAELTAALESAGAAILASGRSVAAYAKRLSAQTAKVVPATKGADRSPTEHYPESHSPPPTR
ncbi:MAG: DEAD/DEAH box helicase [Alphaproteobacteria bacterium]